MDKGLEALNKVIENKSVLMSSRAHSTPFFFEVIAPRLL